MVDSPYAAKVKRLLPRHLVFNSLLKEKRSSRASLAQITGLSLPTVTSVVDELIKLNLVRDVGLGPSSGGRKPMLIEIVPDARYAVAIDLGRANIECALVDLSGKIVDYVQGPPIHSGLRDRLVEEIALLVETMPSFKDARQKILGLGVAMPAVTDPKTGRFFLAPMFGEGEMCIKDQLAARVGLLTFTDNVSNAAALGEVTFGGVRDANPFVCVSTGSGIGAGIIINGEILYGHHFAAGEVGYLIVDKHWVLQAKYGFGCFESLASESAIVQRIKRMILEGYPSYIGYAKASNELTFEDVVEALVAGDPLTVQVIQEVVRLYAMSLANMIAVISPALITLAGGISKLGDHFLLPLQEQLQSMVPYPPEVRMSQFGEKAHLIGAGAIVIRSTEALLLDGG